MSTPCLAHYGTTIANEEVQVGRTLAFHRALGMQQMTFTDYPGLGRQWIFRRGIPDDPAYFEKDAFASTPAVSAPPVGAPRVADTIFRIAVDDPTATLDGLRVAGLVDAEPADHVFVGPDAQAYELATTSSDRAANRAIFIWTDPSDLERITADYVRLFGFAVVDDNADFHGLGRVRVLRRDVSPVTIGLLTPNDGATVAPRLTDDIFALVGYSHFRLGAPDKAAVQACSREAFADTGDVSYVLFNHAYVELVSL